MDRWIEDGWMAQAVGDTTDRSVALAPPVLFFLPPIFVPANPLGP